MVSNRVCRHWYIKINAHNCSLDGELIEKEESKLLGIILRKADISLAVYGIEVKELVEGESDVTYEEMQYVLKENPTTRVLSVDLKEGLKTSESNL